MWNVRTLLRLHAGNFWAHSYHANWFCKLCRTWLKCYWVGNASTCVMKRIGGRQRPLMQQSWCLAVICTKRRAFEIHFQLIVVSIFLKTCVKDHGDSSNLFLEKRIWLVCIKALLLAWKTLSSHLKVNFLRGSVIWGVEGSVFCLSPIFAVIIIIVWDCDSEITVMYHSQVKGLSDLDPTWKALW